MDIGSLLVGLALLAVVAFIVAQPFLDNQGVRERQISTVEALQAERDTVLDALRDLDFDQTMGKLTLEDYTPQRARLVARGVELLKQLDAAVAVAAPAANGEAASLEDQIERAVAARRQGAAATPEAQMEAAIAARRANAPKAAAGSVACPQCATPARAGDRFCGRCGAALPQAAACAQCGTALQPSDRFCAKCGAKVAPASTTEAA